MNADQLKNSRFCRRRRGLTLVEMLVVLVILAILTAVAIQSTSGLADQARYNATQNILTNIQSSVVGPVNQANADTTSLLGGFIADIGRPPVAVANANNDQSQYLAELWSNPLSLPAYTAYGPSTLTPILTTNSFGTSGFPPMPPLITVTVQGKQQQIMSAQIQVMAGWRGPYLLLPSQPANGNQLFDGWGNPFTLLQADMLTSVVPYQTTQPSILPANLVSYVQSQGGSTAPYIGQLTTQSSFTNYTGTVTGSVINTGGSLPTSPIYVLLFYPDMTQSPPVNVAWAIANAKTSITGGGGGTLIGGLTVTGTGTSGQGTAFSFSNVPIGPRVLLLYQGANQVIQYIRVPLGGLPGLPINSNFS